MLFVAMTLAPRPAVVLLEDDENVARLLHRLLTREGFDVSSAATISDARVFLSCGSWDVAILDRNVPDGDGFELAGELRRTCPHSYIVMLTSEDSSESKLEAFSRGADDYVTKPFEADELIARVRAGVRIVRLQKALLESNRKLEELSLTDELTKLRNRRAFDQEFATMFSAGQRHGRPLSLAIVDIDHFKTMNDRYGHMAGDLVLRAIAQMLDASTRESDLVARVGGEEFAVLLPDTPIFEAVQVAEKLRSSVAASIVTIGGVDHHVTVSVGVACSSYSRLRDTQEVYRAADAALYRAKENGRNRVDVERRTAVRDARFATL
jgi:two-component system cell cycle response regulator